MKGAAPAVLERTTTVLRGDERVAWDAGNQQWALNDVQRMGEAGYRVMAAATRDLSADDFDPDGDLLDHARLARLRRIEETDAMHSPIADSSDLVVSSDPSAEDWSPEDRRAIERTNAGRAAKH